jgi:hypothetical protein
MSKIEHTSFAGFHYEPNKKLGYYLVDNEIYYNKYHALLEATKKKMSVKWFFNEDVFIKYPWHVEPEESLEELYRQRAQQIRDSYDYVRVEASGGSDSTTVIFSFLLNNIHLDEVVFRYPKGGDKGLVGNARDLRSENTLSEWQFAAQPLLDWIATNYPKVKITVHDYTESLVQEAETKDESWIFRTRHYLQPGHINKYQVVATNDHKKLIEKNLRICVLWGVDKPKITIKDGKFFFYFADGQASHTDQVVNGIDNITNEFFYWSPDACRLLAKQAHMIKHWFEMPEHVNMQNLLHWPNTNFSGRTVYEQVVKSIIYPKYDLNTFQTFKPTNNIYNEMDYWFHHNFKNTQPYQVWQAGIDYIVNNLDPEFVGIIHERPTNITIFDSVLYCFGESNIADLNLPFAPSKNIKNMRNGDKWAITDPDKARQHAINGKLVIY